MHTFYIAIKKAFTRLYTFLNAFARFSEKVGVKTVFCIQLDFAFNSIHFQLNTIEKKIKINRLLKQLIRYIYGVFNLSSLLSFRHL